MDILLFTTIGFLAQMVDGALGMAFGVICSSSLIAFGLPPAMASASVHTAEIVTTGISGASHLYHRNVDKSLFLKLVITGVLGGIVGAYILAGLPDKAVKILVAIYLIGMALLIFNRVHGQVHLGPRSRPRRYLGQAACWMPLAVVAGGRSWPPR